MARNAVESDFRSSKMAAGGHFVKKNQKNEKLRIDMKWREISVIQNGRPVHLVKKILHFSPLFATFHHVSPLFPTFPHFFQLFATFHHFSPLFTTFSHF